MRRIAELVLRHRKLVLGGWLALFIAGIVCAGQVNKRLTLDFSLPGEPGTTTAAFIEKEFGNGGFTQPYLVSVTAPAGQKVTGHEAQVASTFAAVRTSAKDLRVLDESTSTAGTDKNFFRSKDDRTAFAYVSYAFIHNGAFLLPTAGIEKAAEGAAPTGWTVGVTGEDALAAGESDGAGPGVLVEVLFGGLGALVILVFVFASFLALLPLLVAAASILLSFVFLLPVTYATDVSFIVQFLIALIGLGVAIDYSLLLVNRWREERDHGRDNHDAVIEAMTHAGKAVVFSGVTVAIGLLALVVLPVPFMRSIGIGGALIPLASVITTLTLTPAILGGIGPRVDWPKIRHENVASKGWTRWANTIVKRRVLALTAGLLALGALFSAFLGIKIGLADSGSLASSGPAYTAFENLKSGGVHTGFLTPLQVVVDTDQAVAVADELRGVDGIDKVVVSTEADNVRDGKTVLFAVPDRETVNSTTIEPVRRVKDLLESNPAVLGIAGVGADQIDFLHAVYGNFPLVLGIITVLTFVLLARGFRSVLLPIKAVLLNLFTLAATLGFMVLFWQHGKGSDAIFGIEPTGAVTFWVPLMVFAFLYGLSMDYEVFILSRMREEYDRLGTTDGAVVEGIARTGRLVTSAALILFLSFVALASGPGTDLKVFASALGFGILLDATIVRMLLVPALVSLFGTWNWWMPSWLATVLRVERTDEPAVALAD
ncbi:MAG TPA: MMPL family transporter [Mycobacteriales bacterium]|nr:MMPL family transporter [Mycobacteriales bacterium]